MYEYMLTYICMCIQQMCRKPKRIHPMTPLLHLAILSCHFLNISSGLRDLRTQVVTTHFDNES